MLYHFTVQPKRRSTTQPNSNNQDKYQNLRYSYWVNRVRFLPDTAVSKATKSRYGATNFKQIPKKKPRKNIHKNIYPTHTHSYTTTKKEKNFVASNVLVPSLMLTKAKKEKYHERERELQSNNLQQITKDEGDNKHRAEYNFFSSLLVQPKVQVKMQQRQE